MLVDVRRGVELGVAEEQAAVSVPAPKPPPGVAFPSRRLIMRGRPVFELALWCGTCPAVFQRLSQPEAADLAVVDDRLRRGLDAIDDGLLSLYGSRLPRSHYTILLLEISPRFVRPGDPSDYFAHEQVATWGVDAALDGPEDPGTPYYRTFETPVAGNRHLYEFVVPMVPPSWNDPATVASYATEDSAPATAVAFSLLDVLAPALDEGEDYYEHWVLTHFLLDGHHKMQAAARTGRSVRLLCLVDQRSSIAGPEDFDALVAARRAPSRRRSRDR